MMILCRSSKKKIDVSAVAYFDEELNGVALSAHFELITSGGCIWTRFYDNKCVANEIEPDDMIKRNDSAPNFFRNPGNAYTDVQYSSKCGIYFHESRSMG